MSIANNPSPAGPHLHVEQETWQPELTPKEAVKLGIPKAEYDRLVLWSRTVVEHHQRIGTPRHLWEGNANHNDHFASPYIEDGELERASRLEREIDPVRDEAHGHLEDTKAGLDAAEQHPVPVTPPESGPTYS